MIVTKWTKAEIAVLRDMALDGRSARDIARRLNRSEVSVKSAKVRLGLGRRAAHEAVRKDRISAIKTAWMGDATVAEIGRLFGIATSTVSGLATTHGWPPRRRGCPPTPRQLTCDAIMREDLTDAALYRARGWSDARIAEWLGWHPEQVAERLEAAVAQRLVWAVLELEIAQSSP